MKGTMDRLRFIIPTLIKINLVVALLSAVFVIIIREQQAQMTTYSQQSVDQPDVVPPQIQDKIANYQQKLQEKQEKIDRYEQQLKGLKAELEEYKTQNALLMQANRPKPEPTVSQNWPQLLKFLLPQKSPELLHRFPPKPLLNLNRLLNRSQ